MLKNLFTPENHPYNLALKEYVELENTRTFEEYIAKIGKVIVLAMEAIRLNKNDGDAHVLLADGWRLSGIRYLEESTDEDNEDNLNKKQRYFTSIFSSSAVIYHWKIIPMYSKGKEWGEEVYNDVSNRLDVINDFFSKTNRPTQGMSDLHQKLYESLISLETK
jgi:hypothetical protein